MQEKLGRLNDSINFSVKGGTDRTGKLCIFWEILPMLLSQFPLTFLQTKRRTPLFIVKLMTILVQIGMIFMINWEMFHGKTSLNLMLLRLLLILVSRSGLELMYIQCCIHKKFGDYIFSWRSDWLPQYQQNFIYFYCFPHFYSFLKLYKMFFWTEH